ncbi:MAG: hypothetical protein WCF18_02425 [Chthoniobacteraceae bacterium]
MRYVLTRQLIAPVIAALMISVGSRGADNASREASVAEQLQAARLMQAALAAREAKPEEWRRLDETYADLVAKNPRDAAVRNAHGEFLWERGEQSRAVVEWEAAEQIDPRNSIVLEHLGSGALAAGEARKSAGYFARAVACDPSNAAYHFALANVQFLFRHELLDSVHPNETSLLTEALAHFAEATRLAPGNPEYAGAYAETFYSLPQPDWPAALSAWEHVQLINPQPDFALLHQARIHLKMGHPDAAKACLARIQSVENQKLKSKLEAQAAAQADLTLNPPAAIRENAVSAPP